jgi:hypothetical protein
MCVVVGLVIADIFADATRADAIGPPLRDTQINKIFC